MKIKKIIASALVGVALAANAEENYQARIGEGYTGNLDNEHIFRTTLGIAPAGAYHAKPIPVKGQFMEYFRLYDVNQQKVGDANDLHYTAAGFRNKFNLGYIKNKFVAFGSTGDIEGAAVETEHKIKDLTLTLNAEKRTDNNDTRLGSALSYQINSKLSLGIGYDYVKNSQLKQTLVNALYDFTDRNSAGIAFVNQERPTKTDYHLAAFWNTSGDKGQWGTRVLANANWNDKNENKSFSGDIIVAQYPTTGKYGANWNTGRGVGNDDMYNQSIIPASVSKVESVFLFDRTLGGFSFNAGGQINTGSESGFISGAIGYMAPGLVMNSKLGAEIGLRHSFSADKSIDSIEPAAIIRKKLGNHYAGISAGASIPLSQNIKPIVKTGVIFTW